MTAITDLATATSAADGDYHVISASGTDKKITHINSINLIGTWTPTIIGSTTNPTNTYTLQVGSYVKVGKLLLASFQVSISNTSGGSGNIRIGGLPFAAKTMISYVAVGSVHGLVDFTSGHTALCIQVPTTAQYCELIQYGDNVGAAYVALGALNFTSNFVGSIMYETD